MMLFTNVFNCTLALRIRLRSASSSFEMQPARILDDHVEKLGDGYRRRLHFLAQERGQGPAQAFV